MIESCNNKKRKRTVHSFFRLKKNLTFFFAIYIYIYIYIYLFIYLYISIYLIIYSIYSISIYIYTYIYWGEKTQRSAFFCILLQKNETFLRSFTLFAKERNVLCVLLRSLQKNVAFSAFLYILKKRTHRSFGSHKSPKTQKKNVKECCVL